MYMCVCVYINTIILYNLNVYLNAGDLACNPGMCPHWESNRQPFGSQTSPQSTEPHQTGVM